MSRRSLWWLLFLLALAGCAQRQVSNNDIENMVIVTWGVVAVMLWHSIKAIVGAMSRQVEVMLRHHEVANQRANQQSEAIAQLTEGVEAVGDRLRRMDIALHQYFYPHGSPVNALGVPWETQARFLRSSYKGLIKKKDKTPEEMETLALVAAWLSRGIPGYVPPVENLDSLIDPEPPGPE